MKLIINKFDCHHVRLKNGDIFKNIAEDKNLNDLMCLMWISSEMRFKVVYLNDLKTHKNPSIIHDVLRTGYFLTDNTFKIVGNYIENKNRQIINTSLRG